MPATRDVTVARVYLVVLAIGVGGFAPLYGVAPSTTVPWLFGAPVDGDVLPQLFRATMGLYLAISALWLLGAWRPAWTRAALATAVAFNGGIALGRVAGLILDEFVALLALFGTFEAVMAIAGMVLIRRLGLRS